MRQIEQIEKQRKDSFKHAIKNDFKSGNQDIINFKDQQNSHEKIEQIREKYTHFPFTSGDMIEQHRKTLNSELREELVHFLDKQKQHTGVH